jgi:hypothetical protein
MCSRLPITHSSSSLGEYGLGSINSGPHQPVHLTPDENEETERRYKKGQHEKRSSRDSHDDERNPFRLNGSRFTNGASVLNRFAQIVVTARKLRKSTEPLSPDGARRPLRNSKQNAGA